MYKQTKEESGWYVYPDSRVPEMQRESTEYFKIFYKFNTYGEAWCYLIARFGILFERYNSI